MHNLSQNNAINNYLVHQTVQPNSLRRDFSNYDQFKNQNIALYIHKSVAKLRSDASMQNTSSFQLGQKVNLFIRSGQKAPDPMRKTLIQDPGMKKLQEKVKQEMYNKEHHEQFYSEQPVSQDPKKQFQINQQKRTELNGQIYMMLETQMKEEQLKMLYKDYNLQKLNEKIQTFRELKDPLKIQEKISQYDGIQKQTEQQLEFFMTEICQPKGITAGKLLELNDKQIQYQVIEKKYQRSNQNLALEMLQDLMMEDEKKVIETYKQTKLDDIDPDAFKNKFNMMMFKQKNEMTQNLENDMKSKQSGMIQKAIMDGGIDTNKFIRKRNKFSDHLKVIKERLITEENTILDRKSTNRDDQSTARDDLTNDMLTNRLSMPTPISSPQFEIQSAKNRRNFIMPSPSMSMTKGKSVSTYINNRPSTAATSMHQSTVYGAPSSTKSANLFQKKMFEIDKNIGFLSSKTNSKRSQDEMRKLIEQKKIQLNFNDFLQNCNDALKESQNQTDKFGKVITYMDNFFEKGVDQCEDILKPEKIIQNDGGIANLDEQFKQFRSERLFQKQLLDYLINKVQNQSDLVTKFVVKNTKSITSFKSSQKN